MARSAVSAASGNRPDAACAAASVSRNCGGGACNARHKASAIASASAPTAQSVVGRRGQDPCQPIHRDEQSRVELDRHAQLVDRLGHVPLRFQTGRQVGVRRSRGGLQFDGTPQMLDGARQIAAVGL